MGSLVFRFLLILSLDQHAVLGHTYSSVFNLMKGGSDRQLTCVPFHLVLRETVKTKLTQDFKSQASEFEAQVQLEKDRRARVCQRVGKFSE